MYYFFVSYDFLQSPKTTVTGSILVPKIVKKCLLTAHMSSLTAHHLLLTAHHSLLTAHILVCPDLECGTLGMKKI
jgi:hypothetical protein